MTYTNANESAWIGYAQYAWKGSVVVCRNCGEIHRTWKHWYGNAKVEDYTVR